MKPAHAAVVTALLFVLTPALWAQPSWNRKVEAVAVIPSPSPGQHDVYVAWTVSVEPTSVPLDLSTEFELSINGVPVSTAPLPLSVDAGAGTGCDDCAGPTCGGGCGTGEVGGEVVTFLCTRDRVCPTDPSFLECQCIVPGPSCCGNLVAVGTAVPLTAKDKIIVLLRPAPGALPESDSSDDALTVAFGGDAIYWDRKIESVAVVPTPGLQDSFFDIFVDISVEANYDGVLDPSAEVELRVNGVPTESFPVIFDDLIWNPCNDACDNACVMDAGGGGLGVCDLDQDGPLSCSCQLAPVGLVFPSTPATPGDEIMVLLRPAPGALPELPGFEEDDIRIVTVPPPCPWDCQPVPNGNVGISDLLSLLAQWGAAGPCDFDGGGVGIGDLLALLANWGACP
jgi:hypothetical protein